MALIALDDHSYTGKMVFSEDSKDERERSAIVLQNTAFEDALECGDFSPL
jgi:hypothetical protein